MILIIGGAYQGKLDYARQQFQLSSSDILDCTQLTSELCQKPLTAKCIYHYEAYIEQCLLANIEPQTAFSPDQIVIADDIFCGVVPIDSHLRAWRETCGRTLTALAIDAQSVIRIFCGLPLKVK